MISMSISVSGVLSATKLFRCVGGIHDNAVGEILGRSTKRAKSGLITLNRLLTSESDTFSRIDKRPLTMAGLPHMP
jgi:hypothetical protein